MCLTIMDWVAAAKMLSIPGPQSPHLQNWTQYPLVPKVLGMLMQLRALPGIGTPWAGCYFMGFTVRCSVWGPPGQAHLVNICPGNVKI